MMTSLEKTNYYYIIDERLNSSPVEQAKIAIKKEVKMIQYRRKNASGKLLYQEAKDISEMCKERAIFIINDRVDIALAVDADGVHLGQDDLPYDVGRDLIGDKILGVSTHSLEQAIKAEKTADYIGVGPVHSTKTKEYNYKELGIQEALRIAEKVNIPTAAIGGIEYKDLRALSNSFDMICAISSVTGAGDLSANIERFEKSIKDFKRDI